MITITFNSEKGGTGKTTLSTHVAAGLAIRGYNVLLVDTDPQGNATQNLSQPKEPGFYNMMVREDEYSIGDVIRLIDPAVYHIPGEPVAGHLALIPSNRESYNVSNLIQYGNPLAENLEDLQGVDVAIIDTPPTPGLLMTLIYEVTDFLIAPTQLEALSISGLSSVLGVLGKADVRLMGIIPNLCRLQTSLHMHNLKLLMKQGMANNWTIWPPISERTVWAEASQVQKMVWTLMPESKAAKEIWKMIDLVEGGIRQWQRST